MASNSRAASRLPGRGSPCEMIVDSSATTGAPDRSAALTGGDTSTRDDTRTIVSLAGYHPVSTPRPCPLVTLRYGLPGRTRALEVTLPRLGHVIRPVGSDRVDRTDDDDRAPGGAQADPDDRTSGPVRIGAPGVAAEDQHVRVRRLVEQHARGQPLGDLGAHADAREQVKCFADRTSQHVTGGSPAAAGLSRRRNGIARYLMTRGLQSQHGEDLRGAQARFAARPPERGH